MFKENLLVLDHSNIKIHCNSVQEKYKTKYYLSPILDCNINVTCKICFLSNTSEYFITSSMENVFTFVKLLIVLSFQDKIFMGSQVECFFVLLT